MNSKATWSMEIVFLDITVFVKNNNTNSHKKEVACIGIFISSNSHGIVKYNTAAYPNTATKLNAGSLIIRTNS
ncbi:hypothetical protein D3C75_1287410 [compost metagenome]